LKNGTEDIKYIAEKPYDEEANREGVCRGAAEILNDLRREDNNPAGN
jgi:hypothetical protein